MLKTIKTAALSALIGLGALAGAPAAAQAGDYYLGIGGGHSGIELRFGEHRRHHWDRDRWERPRHYRACSPNRALNKAERMGVRRAYVRDVSRRFIRIGGRAHGERVVVTFARTPQCPVVRWS